MATYYVAPAGNDGADGSIGAPWASFQHAVNTVSAGDYVYFRGGTYYPTNKVVISAGNGDGAANNKTHYEGYQDEEVIFDYSNYIESSHLPLGVANNWSFGIFMGTGVRDVYFKNFTITNIRQNYLYTEVTCIYSQYAFNLTFENIICHDNDGRGFMHEGGIGYYGITEDITSWINCDSYNNEDVIECTSGMQIGNQADGFKMYGEPGGVITYTGCRAWNCSDDGWDSGTDQTLVIENCWSFLNGKALGDGEGWKTGNTWVAPGRQYKKVLKNNIAAYNRLNGFFLLDYVPYFRNDLRYYNNLAVRNGVNGFATSMNVDDPDIISIWRNNIAYDNVQHPISNTYQPYTESNNTWNYIPASFPGYDEAFTLTDGDFLSLDVTQLSRPRKVDGSLPDVTFGKLAPTSPLIGAGIKIETSLDGFDVLYDANGNPFQDPPSLGPTEYVLNLVEGTWGLNRGILNSMFAALYSRITTNIIADHSIVNDYSIIPQYYIDEVKKKLVTVAGMSHSKGYYVGAELLSALDPKFAVDTSLDVEPLPAYTDTNLRIARPWMSGETIWTSQSGIDTSKIYSIRYPGPPAQNYDAWIFGWSYQGTWTNDPGGTIDPVYNVRWAGSSEGGPDGNLRWGLDSGDEVLTGNSVCMDTYLDALEQFEAYCAINYPTTKIVYSTLIVDSNAGTEAAFQRELKSQHIRNYIGSNTGKVLFDFGDILSHNNSGQAYTSVWDDGGTPRPHAQIHPDNLMDYDGAWNPIAWSDTDGDHIGEVGALRLGKALWWMLARMEGWNGLP